MTYPDWREELREIELACARQATRPGQSPTEVAASAQAVKKTGLAGVWCDVCGASDCGGWVPLPDWACRDCEGLGWSSEWLVCPTCGGSGVIAGRSLRAAVRT